MKRCKVFGHKWIYTCIGTWGNDDWWQCERCGKATFENDPRYVPDRWRGTYANDAAGWVWEYFTPLGLVGIAAILVFLGGR